MYTVHPNSQINIVKSIKRIDSFLLKYNIPSGLNDKNIEYRLEKEGFPFINIKISPDGIQYEIFSSPVENDQELDAELTDFLLNF